MIEDDRPGEIAVRVSATDARKSLFALEVARGKTAKQAAKAAGISEPTAYRWLGDRDVATMANNYRLRIVRETIGKLTALGARATERLAGLIDSADEGVAFKASVAVLNEVRRVADAIAAPVVARYPTLEQSISDFYASEWLASDPDDEPLPPLPETDGLTKAEASRREREWSQKCHEIAMRNCDRRECDQKFAFHQKQVEAEAMAASMSVEMTD